MGSNTSATSDVALNPKYNPNLTGFQIIGEGDTYNIWRNRTTGEELQQYIQTSASEPELRYIKDVFEFRYNQNHIVSSLFFKDNTRKQMCSTFYQASVFLERIPLRLNEINDLPFPDSLHLAHACLHGFHELYERVGSFTVSQSLIGVNMDAQVKVWISPDFGREKLSLYGQPPQHNETGMVAEIVAVLDRVIDHRTEPESLINFILRGGLVTFGEAIARLHEYTVRYRVLIPDHLKSIAALRDRGYFKKMPPSRKTTFIGQSNYSLTQSHNHDSVRFNSLPQPSLQVPIAVDTISPVLAAGTVPIVPPPDINNFQTFNPIHTGTPTHIRGIPVVQNPNTRVNTYYSNIPVGGSFPISSFKRGVSPLPVQNRVQQNVIETNLRAVTPTRRPITPTYQPAPLTPMHGHGHGLPHHKQFPKVSEVIKQTPVVKSVYTQKGSLTNQVQNILRQLRDLSTSQPKVEGNIALSGYLSDYTPTYEPVSSYNYNDNNNYVSHSSTYSSYQPTAEGFTSPDLLKLTYFQKTVQKSYDDFVTNSYNPSIPEVSSSYNYTGNDDYAIKSILKNRMDNTADFGSNKSYMNNFGDEYQSKIISESKPFESEHMRTIYNKQEFNQLQEVKYTKQVETYRANIKIHTPEDLHRQRLYM